MKKINHKTKVMIVIIAILLIFATLAVLLLRREQCTNIIGDGYAMGTDPEPVVIGNSCDQ